MLYAFLLQAAGGFASMALGCALMLALSASLILGRLAISWAKRLHFLDHPGERKVQEAPVPLLGGLAIILAVILGAGLYYVLSGPVPDGPMPDAIDDASALLGVSFLLRWLGAGFLLLITGLVDDRRGLSPLIRLAVQGLTACAFLPELGAWLGGGAFFLPALIIGGVWVLGLINSLNFLDNMDAASASTGFWTSQGLALLFFRAGQPLAGAAALVLSAALAGFLWWNRPPARLYMGDAGSTFLGFSLAVMALLAVLRAGLDPWLAPLLLAVPIYDTASVFWIRRREGRPLWVGDRRHATHRLQARGRSVAAAVLILNCWTLAALLLVLLVYEWGRGGAVATGLALVVGALVFRWEMRWEKRRADKS